VKEELFFEESSMFIKGSKNATRAQTCLLGALLDDSLFQNILEIS
jgi:hypothetical protein